MAERVPVIYGLEFQSRALTSRIGETERIQFLCGTQTIRNENQIHLVDYDEETTILNKLVYPYSEGEIWNITCSAADKDLVAVTTGKIDKEGQYVRRANLIRLDGGTPDETDVGTVSSLGELPSLDGVQCTSWYPAGGSHNQLVVVTDKANVSLWSIDTDTPRETGRIQLDSRGRLNYSSISWNSHHNYSTVLVTADSALYSWDMRTKKTNQLLDHHHGPCIRDIDSNPNRPYYFLSCGDDCTTQFWDWRKLQGPLVTRRDHSHWVWSAQYNLSYDQLVLSGSSDSQVLLTRVASVASEPLKHLDDEDEPALPPTDNVISVYEEHEDSVYNVKWSTTDAWIFASLSYDGRLVINHVPTNEKYAILTA